jgi:hypothetical protein
MDSRELKLTNSTRGPRVGRGGCGGHFVPRSRSRLQGFARNWGNKWHVHAGNTSSEGAGLELFNRTEFTSEKRTGYTTRIRTCLCVEKWVFC